MSFEYMTKYFLAENGYVTVRMFDLKTLLMMYKHIFLLESFL